MSALFDAIDANPWLVDGASILALGIGTLWLVALAIADVTRAWREGGEP